MTSQRSLEMQGIVGNDLWTSAHEDARRRTHKRVHYQCVCTVCVQECDPRGLEKEREIYEIRLGVWTRGGVWISSPDTGIFYPCQQFVTVCVLVRVCMHVCVCLRANKKG